MVLEVDKTELSVKYHGRALTKGQEKSNFFFSLLQSYKPRGALPLRQFYFGGKGAEGGL